MNKILILLTLSLIIEIKSNICETFEDCNNCTLNFNCIWNINKCELKTSENYNQLEWWNLFFKCGENHNNIYCGDSKIEDLGNQIQSLSLSKVNEGYGISGLLCSYSFLHEKIKNNLRIEYSIKTTVYNIAYPKISIKFFFNDDTSSIIELTRNQIFNYKNIKKVEIYVLCYEKYFYNPFLITFLTKDKIMNQSIIIFILLALIVLIIIIVIILHFICSNKKEPLNVNENEIRNENEFQNINILSSNRRNEINFNRIEIINEVFKNLITEIVYQDLIKKKKSKEKCSICLEGFQEEKENIKNNKINNQKANKIIMTPCEHFFHYKCLFTWLSKSNEHIKCPNCNFLFINDEEIEKLILNANNIHNHNNNNYSTSNISSSNNISNSGSRRNFSITSNNMRILRLNINN